MRHAVLNTDLGVWSADIRGRMTTASSSWIMASDTWSWIIEAHRKATSVSRQDIKDHISGHFFRTVRRGIGCKSCIGYYRIRKEKIFDNLKGILTQKPLQQIQVSAAAFSEIQRGKASLCKSCKQTNPRRQPCEGCSRVCAQMHALMCVHNIGTIWPNGGTDEESESQRVFAA